MTPPAASRAEAEEGTLKAARQVTVTRALGGSVFQGDIAPADLASCAYAAALAASPADTAVQPAYSSRTRHVDIAVARPGRCGVSRLTLRSKGRCVIKLRSALTLNGNKLAIIARIEEPAVIARILAHLD